MSDFFEDLAGFIDYGARKLRTPKPPEVTVLNARRPFLKEPVKKVAFRGMPAVQGTYANRVGLADSKVTQGSEGMFAPNSKFVGINTVGRGAEDISAATRHELAHARQSDYLGDLTLVPQKALMGVDSLVRNLVSSYQSATGNEKGAFKTYEGGLGEMQARDAEKLAVPEGIPEADREMVYDKLYRKSMLNSTAEYLQNLLSGM